MPHRILHVDRDAFYADVEQRDTPELKGKPIAMGWSEQGAVRVTSVEAVQPPPLEPLSAQPPCRRAR